MNLIKTNMARLLLGMSTGAVLGYAYYYFIGCQTGSCPLTSNPIISTVYGAVAGLIISMPSKKQEATDGKDS